MSANIVDENCLNVIVNFLFNEKVDREWTRGECFELLKKRGYNLDKSIDCKRLFRDLLKLNIQAVESRYTDDHITYLAEMAPDETLDHMETRPRKKRFEYIDYPKNIYQSLKSIDCWLYNCYEGEPMESSMLVATLRNVRDIIHSCLIQEIIEQIPEYKEAAWG